MGAAFCFPTGYLTDRFGLRVVAGGLTFLLGLTVWKMSAFAGSVVALFVLITLTRALGQSALSVVSITAVGKSVAKAPGLAMGIYSVLLSVFFVIAFGVVGHSVQQQGWRAAWHQIAAALLFVITPLVLIFLRDQAPSQPTKVLEPSLSLTQNPDSLSLPQALRTSAFWIFGVGIALFCLVSSGLGLFQQAVLAEHGFDQKTYIDFLMVTTLVALLGQLLCGWLTLRLPLRQLMGVGLFLYSIALVFLPFIRTKPQLWLFALVIGAAGGFITVMFFAVWGRLRPRSPGTHSRRRSTADRPGFGHRSIALRRMRQAHWFLHSAAVNPGPRRVPPRPCGLAGGPAQTFIRVGNPRPARAHRRLRKLTNSFSASPPLPALHVGLSPTFD